MGKWIRCLTVTLISLSVVVLGAPTALAAKTNFDLTTSPVSAVINAKPGSVATTTMHVVNNSPVPLPLTIKLFTFGAAGTSGKPALRQPSTSDSFIKWARFSPAAFIAQPNVPVAVTMTIDVPKTASLGYNYGVAFEPVTPDVAAFPGTTTVSGSNVVLILLNATTASEVRSVRITSFTASKKLYEYLPVNFSINVHNSGNIFLAPGGDIFISKSPNFTPGSIIDTIPVNSGQGNILPGTNRVFTASWTDGFPVYVLKQIDGHQVMKNNRPQYSLSWNFAHANKMRFGKYYAKLIMSYDNGTRQIPVVAVLSFWVVPWELLGLIAFIVLLFIGLVIGVIYLVLRLRKLKRQTKLRHG